MKKYMLIALLPFIFQSKIYGDANLNKAIQPSLISARRAINNVNLPVELDAILPALISFAKSGQDQSIEAINKITAIRNALQQYKSDQYTAWTTFTSWFNYHPEIVIDHINPAIAQVNAALVTLKNNSSNAGYTIAATLAGATILAIAAAGAVLALKQKNDDADLFAIAEKADADYRSNFRHCTQDGQPDEQRNNPFHPEYISPRKH